MVNAGREVYLKLAPVVVMAGYERMRARAAAYPPPLPFSLIRYQSVVMQMATGDFAIPCTPAKVLWRPAK
jgi:hypothetical protein